MNVSKRVSFFFFGSLPLSSDPPLPFHRSPFSEFGIVFLGLLNRPSLVRIGTFFTRNRALPRSLHRRHTIMRAFHLRCRFGGTSSPSLSTHQHHPPPSTCDAQTVHLPCWASTWVGSNPLPSTPCTTTFRWRYFRQLTVADHTTKNIDPFSAPKRPSGFFGP